MNGSRMTSILIIKKWNLQTGPTHRQSSMRIRKQRDQGDTCICQECQRSPETIRGHGRDKGQCLSHSSQKDSSHRPASVPYSAHSQISESLLLRRPCHWYFLHSPPRSGTSRFLDIPESWMPLVCVQWSCT